MKDGAGDLDFGEGNDDSDANEAETKTDETPPSSSSHDDTQQDRSQPRSPVKTSGSTAEQRDVQTTTPDEQSPATQEYPYFVRRSNVGDERDERIEAHLRNDVYEAEDDFRSNLADAFGENGQIAKTDAREFALKFAFEHPEEVAELMRQEGYGLVD